ncbi:hypothetical protein TYRP_001590 [Tyrophagus putrescentiae]|nr:hypothetical protein TYRP_001590 [Tyrophagus putrescentiae]
MYYLVADDHGKKSQKSVAVYMAKNFEQKLDDPPAGFHRENITDWKDSARTTCPTSSSLLKVVIIASVVVFWFCFSLWPPSFSAVVCLGRKKEKKSKKGSKALEKASKSSVAGGSQVSKVGGLQDDDGIGWLQVVLLALLPFCFGVLDSSQNESPSNDICTEKDKPDFKLPLLGAMIFPKTSSSLTATLGCTRCPALNYEGSYGQMTLNIKGVPMERYWPALAEVAQDDCFRQTYKTIYHLIFNKTGNCEGHVRRLSRILRSHRINRQTRRDNGVSRETSRLGNMSRTTARGATLQTAQSTCTHLDRVVIFEDRMPGYEEINKEARWGQLLARSEVTVVMMSEYFQCDTPDRNVTVPPEPDPKGNHTGGNSARFSSPSAASSLLKVVIIASVVALLILFFRFGRHYFCCCFDGKEKKSKEKKSMQGSKASKALEKASKSSVAGGSQVSKVGGSKMTMASKQGSAVVDDKKHKTAGTSQMSKSPSNDICTEKDKPDFKLPLLGAMIFPESILLIDGHFRMYEVPRSNYEGSYGQMTMNIKGVPMERYWPAFAEVAQDDCFRQTYKTIYHLIFNKTGNVLIMFDVREGSCENVGWCYNSKAQTLCPNPTVLFKRHHMQFYIDSGMKIYGIEAYGPVASGKGSGTFFPQMTVWHFEYRGEVVERGKSTFPLLMYYLVADKKDDTANTQKSVAIYMADDFEEELDDPPAGFHRENITDWNLSKDYLPVGYLFNGSFYLYALDRVVIFEDRMPDYFEVKNDARWGQLLARSEVTVVLMSEYFQCDTPDRNVTVPPEPEPGNHTGGNSARFSSPSKQSSLKVVIIASVVVFLLLIFVVAAIIFCCCSAGKKKEKKSKKGSKALEKASKSSVAGGSQASKLGGFKMTMVASKQGSAVVDDKKHKAVGSFQMSKVAPQQQQSKLDQKKKGKKKNYQLHLLNVHRTSAASLAFCQVKGVKVDAVHGGQLLGGVQVAILMGQRLFGFHRGAHPLKAVLGGHVQPAAHALLDGLKGLPDGRVLQ